MWWVMAAQAAIGAINSWSDRQIAKINTHLSEVQAETGNRIRQSQNDIQQSRNTLSRYMQSVANQRRMAAGGRAIEANEQNYLRERDALQAQDFRTQIRYMEQAGASRATQAASGSTGDVADMVNYATALRQSQTRQQFADAGDMAASDQRVRAQNILRSMSDGLDSSIIFDNLDYKQDYSQRYEGPKWQHAAAMAVIGNGASTRQVMIDIGDATKKAYDWGSQFFKQSQMPSEADYANETTRRFSGAPASYDTGVSLDFQGTGSGSSPY